MQDLIYVVPMHPLVHQLYCLVHTGSPTLLFTTHWFTNPSSRQSLVHAGPCLRSTHAPTGSPTLLFSTHWFTNLAVYHTLARQPHQLLYLHFPVIYHSLPLSVCLGRILTHAYSIWGLSSFNTCVTMESP